MRPSPELEEKIREELCSRGLCFGPKYGFDIVATSEQEYLEYVREFLEEVCPCLKDLNLLGDVAEIVADRMLGDTVFYVEVDGEEYYVRAV